MTRRRTSSKRNPGSRALSGPAMDTRFGRNVDPDRVREGGADLDRAMDRYETFHAKRPLRAVALGHLLPKKVVPVGQAISTMYRTDKWHDDGDDEDYKHVHDPEDGRKSKEYTFGEGVVVYEPASQVKKSKVERDSDVEAEVAAAEDLPVRAPKAITLLGYCLGFFVRRFDDGQVYEVNPRGCYLFCSPDGDMLAVYSPDEQPDGSRGFLAVMAGGKLDVIKDGIVG